MAGKTEIGNLVVKIGATASEFEHVLEGAERRLTGFASKVTSPIGFGSKVGGLAAGVASGPLGVLGSAASTLFSPESASVLNLEKISETMEAVVNRTAELGREARRLDFEPRFLAALRHTAGPDAEAAEAGVRHYLQTVGEAKLGNEEAQGKLRTFGLGGVVDQTSQEAVLAYADRMHELGDRSTQAAMSHALMRDRTGEAAAAFAKGAEAIRGNADELARLNAYSEDQVRIAQAMKAHEREFKQKKDAKEQQEAEQYGFFFPRGKEKMALNPVVSKEFWSGVDDVMKGYGGWLAVNVLGAKVGRPGSFDEPEQAPASPPMTQLEKDQQAAGIAAGQLTEKLHQQRLAIEGVTEAEKVDKMLANPALSADAADSLRGEYYALRQAKPNKEIDDLTTSLERQYQFWGLSAERVKLYSAQLDGLDVTKVRKATEAIERVEQERLKDQTRSPLERFRKNVSDLNETFRDTGWDSAESRDLVGRGLGKYARELIGQAGIGDFRLTGAALRGSAEEASIINRDTTQRESAGRSPMEKLQAAAEALKAAAERDRQFEQELLSVVEENGIGVITGDGG